MTVDEKIVIPEDLEVKTLVLINQLIEISESDLQASKILFQQGLYPHAVFYLQQSVEKLVKTIGLKTGAIVPSELKNRISHNTIKVYLKGVQKVLGYLNLFKKEDDQYSISWIKNIAKSLHEYEKKISS